MEMTSHEEFRNNTVRMTVRLNHGDSLYLGMMNVTQTVAVTVGAKTTSDDEKAFDNGGQDKIYRPEKVLVKLQEPNGQHLGTFRIDPERAMEYRTLDFSANAFAEHVVDTVELERDIERGSHSPGWYLNRSQLHDWLRAYKVIFKKESDPSTTSFTQQMPLDAFTIHPEDMRIHYEVVWQKDEMGQAFLSGSTVMDTAYYKTIDNAWAIAPRRLSKYYHRPGIDDVRESMDREHVYWILSVKKNNSNLVDYYNSAETEGIDDE